MQSRPDAENGGEVCGAHTYVSSMLCMFTERFKFLQPHADIAALNDELNELCSSLNKSVDVMMIKFPKATPDETRLGQIVYILNGLALVSSSSAVCANLQSADPRLQLGSRLEETAYLREILRKELALLTQEMGQNMLGGFAPVSSNKTVARGDLNACNVLFTGKEIIVGVPSGAAGGDGADTNVEGAQDVARAFPEYVVSVVPLPPQFRSLRDAVSMAGPDILAVGSSSASLQLLASIQNTATYAYKLLRLPEDHATHMLFINNTLYHLAQHLIPKSYSKIQNEISHAKVALNLANIYKANVTLPELVVLINSYENIKQFNSTLN